LTASNGNEKNRDGRDVGSHDFASIDTDTQAEDGAEDISVAMASRSSRAADRRVQDRRHGTSEPENSITAISNELLNVPP